MQVKLPLISLISFLALPAAALAAPKDADLTTEQTSQNQDEPTNSSGVFPDWAPDAFDWSLGPVIGVRARATEYDGVKYDSVLSEAGLGARVQGIPIIPGNPGLTLEPYGTYTFGNRTQKEDGADYKDTDSSGFQRFWYGINGKLMWKFFRYSLDIGRGKINFDDKEYQDLTANRISNDFGFMIIPHFSAHYTLTSYQLREDRQSRPAIDEIDHWVHARMSFQTFSTQVDVGPGHTRSEFASINLLNGNYEKYATTNTDYLKALASMHIFWKLGLSGYAKYIINATDNRGANDFVDQLPNENLAESKSIAFLPEDSFEGSLFFGLKNLIGGFGFGWQIYYLELAQADERKQISRDSGLVLSYDAGF